MLYQVYMSCDRKPIPIYKNLFTGETQHFIPKDFACLPGEAPVSPEEFPIILRHIVIDEESTFGINMLEAIVTLLKYTKEED